MLALVTCCLLGCQSALDSEVPAVVDNDSVAEISDVIATALGRSVELSAQAFSKSNLVTLAHRPAQTIAGRPATGLTVEKPEQFRLVQTTAGCALIRVKTAERFGLRETRCRAQQTD